MATVILIEASPWSSADGSVQSIRLAGGGKAGRPYNGYRGFSDWKSGVANRPLYTAAIGFDETGWTGGAVPQTASIRFMPSTGETLDTLSALQWVDAPVTIRAGDDRDGAPAAWTVELTGTIAAAAVTDGALTLTIGDLATALDVKLLTARFTGGGGVEGPAEAEGRIKRRTFGQVSNVEGFLLDKANSIYEFGDPAFPIEAFDAVRDKGRAGVAGAAIAWQGSVAATFAALQAASTSGVDYRAAPSIACVKWWTQPAGPITADIRGENTGGYTNTVGDIAARLAAIGGVSLGAGVAAATTALRPYVVGIHVDSDSETIANALDRLLLPVSLTWALNADGTVGVLEFQLTTSTETIIAEAVERVETFRPIKTRRLGYLKNHRVQSDGEISPAATSADSAVYADGTPIDDLRPAEAGANVTETRTSAAISGQGALATQNSADFATQVGGAQKPANNATVGAIFGSNLLETIGGVVATLAAFKTSSGTAAAIAGQGALATLAAVAFGDGTVKEASGGATAELAAFKTALGTASAILSQGDLATQNTAAWLTQITGTGKPEDNATVGAAAGVNLKESSGGAVLALDAIKTILGTAAGFTGQGALATKNQAAAADISVSSLSSIAADIGIVTAGLLRSATSSTQLDLNNNRLLFNNGSVMLVAGVGFGSSNQFILWFGPSQANFATCTEANATFFLKTNGDAYFGGSLSAGVLTTKAQTSSLASNAEIETAAFGSNGNQIVVTMSYSHRTQDDTVYPATTTGRNNFDALVASLGATSSDGVNYSASGSTTEAATLQLARSLAGSGYANVATLNVNGSYIWTGVRPDIPDSVPGSGRFIRTMGGSTTYNDPTLSTQNRQYKAAISSRTLVSTTAETQNVSIVAVEE